MKNKLKRLLAVILSAACILTVMPLSGFAADEPSEGSGEDKIISYKVIFDLNGGEGEIEEITAKTDEEITLPDENSAVYEGKKLIGWNSDKEGGEKSFSPGEKVKNLSETDGAEIILYAVWMDTDPEETPEENPDSGENEETVEYTITYYLSEKEPYGEEKKYAAGSTIVHPEDPKKEGFKFAGWILGEEGGKPVPVPSTMPSENLKAYASWEIQSYTISYTVDGVTTAKTALFGSDIAKTVPADPKKDGHVFAGWFDKNGKNLYDYSTVPSNDIEFTAKWLRNGNVVYLVDGKTYEAYEVREGEKIPVPENPKKFAHKFKGWNPEIPDVMPSNDLEFKAQWEIDKDFVTLVIGGTVVAGGIMAAIAGAAITGISVIGGIIAIIGVASNIKKSYTVTYKVDGSVYKTYKHEAGEKITVPANPTKSGYKFEGWTPDIPEKMPKKNLTFEAKWSEIKDDSNNSNTEIPSTGSTNAGIAAFAALAISAVAAIIIKKKKDK